MRKVEVLERELLYDGFFKLERAVVRYEKFDGSMSEPITRLNLERGDSVGVLLYNPETDSVVLVEQFRYPAYVRGGPGWLLEIVAGMKGENEDSIRVARAEAIEEAGYEIRRIERLTSFYLSPGGCSEKLDLYLGYVGRRSGEGGGVREEGEDVRVVELPFEEALRMVDEGRIMDAKTIVALLWLYRRRRECGSGRS
ncbi:NUDIX hydrolase [Candidatus Poribacteria bacterium]|nr:MAG: NUDIX hydrolase [Candidatus Poribacteria bacterium]